MGYYIVLHTISYQSGTWMVDTKDANACNTHKYLVIWKILSGIVYGGLPNVPNQDKKWLMLVHRKNHTVRYHVLNNYINDQHRICTNNPSQPVSGSLAWSDRCNKNEPHSWALVITSHHDSWLCIIIRLKPLSNFFNDHQAPWAITNHGWLWLPLIHTSSWIITDHNSSSVVAIIKHHSISLDIINH